MTATRLFYLSNYVPEEIVDIIRFDWYEPQMRMENFCSYVLGFISSILYDAKSHGAVIANSCDSVRCVREMVLNQTAKFIHQIKHPLTFSDNAVLLFAEEIKKYKSHYENHFNVKIKESDIEQRIELLDKKYSFLDFLYRDIGSISYYEYISAINRSFFSPLSSWRKELDISYSRPGGTKPLFLFGPYLSDPGIIKKIEDFGGKIVGDYLTNSKRYFSVNVLPTGKKPANIYETIAGRNLGKVPSPTCNNFRQIIKKNLCEIESKAAVGVIFIYRKYCEPYDFLFPLLKKELAIRGIKSLKIQVENKKIQGNELDNVIAPFIDML